MSCSLASLLPVLPHFELSYPIDGVEIEGVVADSRRVGPGFLFVAIAGATVDGHQFIPDAVAHGAVAVVGSAAPGPWAVPYVRVTDPRSALALLAAAWHRFPGRQLRLVGVTGTDGKTTTANLIYRVLLVAGHVPGMISTVSARIGSQDLDTGFHVTTPDAPDIQGYLAQMRDAGCDSAILEATSHGLAQDRLAACDFDVAVVTNVTHEHLDYHGSWDSYLDAKATLFRALGQSMRKAGQRKVAVLNADDASYGPLRAIEADWHLSYGIENTKADLWAQDVSYWRDRTRVLIHTPDGPLPVETTLPGRFNVYNCLAALGAGLALGLEPEQIAQGIAGLPGIVGRMERIGRGQDFLAIVDFAHTPASLARVLEAVRGLTSGRVIAVIGSAGLRDVQKRALMAGTAVRLADQVLLTAEDPRTESVEEILAQMASGAERAGGEEGRDFQRIADRTDAIWQAVAEAASGDVVLVCGKGHERSMCFGSVEYPWSDQAVLAWALERRLGLTALPPPFQLPTAVGRVWQGERDDIS